MADHLKDPVLAAITTAVANYMALQESAPGPGSSAAPGSSSRNDGTSYGASGRMQMMDERRLLSMRLKPRKA